MNIFSVLSFITIHWSNVISWSLFLGQEKSRVIWQHTGKSTKSDGEENTPIHVTVSKIEIPVKLFDSHSYTHSIPGGGSMNVVTKTLIAILSLCTVYNIAANVAHHAQRPNVEFHHQRLLTSWKITTLQRDNEIISSDIATLLIGVVWFSTDMKEFWYVNWYVW